MRYSKFLVLGAAVVLALVLPSAALGHTSKATYDWHLGDALLQSFGFPAGEQAMADNGDVVTLEGTSSFSADGTWIADGLISFQFYGCGGEGLPDNFCGGLLKLAITATPDANPALQLPATLWINCEVGPDVPASVIEGVRLNVYDVINFNKPVPESGANIYIQQ